MLVTLCLCLLASGSGDLASPLALHQLTVERASALHGSEVEVWLEVGKPTLAMNGVTMVGPDDQDDDVELVVYLKGERYDIAQGESIIVSGTLRLIRHDEATVNGVVIPAWTEIQVEQAKAKPSGR